MYGELYSNTWTGLKKADPGLRVGGPATAQLAWLDDFIECDDVDIIFLRYSRISQLHPTPHALCNIAWCPC